MEEHRPNDDIFKKILENHPEFETDPSAIKDMKRRLDEAEHTGRNRGVGWWLPLLFIPFLIGTVVLLFQNRNLNSQINQLQTQINIEKNDTLEHKFITYHFDTIYTTIYEEKIVNRVIYNNQTKDLITQNSKALNYYDNNFRALVTSEPAEYFVEKRNPFRYSSNSLAENNNAFTSLQAFNFSQNKNNQNKELKDAEMATFSSNEAIFIPTLFSPLKEKKDELISLDLEEHTLDFKKWRKPPVYYLTPKNFRIGVEGSPVGFIDINGEQGFKPMYSYGIGAEVGFTNQFKMTFGIRKADLKFETKDPLQMAKYPSILPNDPTDFVREMYVIINQLQIPISFKYLISTNKKWKPFLSAGIVASRPLRQKFKYNFITSSFEQYNSELIFNEGVFSIKNFESAFGLDYDITSKWVANAQIFYLHDLELNVGEYFRLQNLGLNLGLKYKL